ncbi:ANT(3'')-II family aminoglycoside nucleotidyltransferase [Acinetobacter courvalinii]|uniref:Aminoglycoside (3'') (9) adenylyltransferase n=1 Tax=Acinetobacter courvalinii TaxID=280147 RepID=A0AA42I9U9_9GAMM|nr:ANT(3'')-II family aminoglycoside nucleotidyltransferase [Acinetobacter courvalinii]MDH0565170.1 ANT(3'')-II family aminoglycoside nucleotidyltransferase [Acinetobacter courvalinii]
MSETLQLEQLTGYLQQLLGESLFAIYLYGSAVDGGLAPESDLDILVVLSQAMTLPQRQQLAETLLQISHPAVGAAQRALEVTIVRKDHILSGSYPLSYELQFGEWLRDELSQGDILGEHADPDLSILLKKAQMHHQTLFGPDLNSWSVMIPDQQLWQAMADTYPSIVAHWDEDADERNQILALCRIYFSLVTNEIAPKDQAAQWVIAQLQPQHQPVLQRLVQEYKGEIEKQNWQQQHHALQPVVDFLSLKIDEQFRQRGLLRIDE